MSEGRHYYRVTAQGVVSVPAGEGPGQGPRDAASLAHGFGLGFDSWRAEHLWDWRIHESETIAVVAVARDEEEEDAG